MVLALKVLTFILSFQSGAFATDVFPTEILNSLRPLTEKNSLPSPGNSKDIILYFWATWCPDCKTKLTSIFADKEIYKKFDVYLIATDKDIAKMAHYQDKNSIYPAIAIDEKRILQNELKVFSVPTFIRLRREDNNLRILNQQSGGSIENLVK